MRIVSKVKVLAGALGLLLALVLVLCLVMPALAIPGTPEAFWGTVTGNGSQVGFIVSARIGGVEFGNCTVDSQGRYGEPMGGGWSTTGPLQVSADDPDTTSVKEGGVNGDTIDFYVNGVLASPTATFASGSITELDLTVGAVTQYTLTVSSTDGGDVTAPGEGNFTYSPGTVVNLVATPSTGCFVNWTGNTGTMGNASAASGNITMNGNYAIQANFVPQYVLNVSSGAGGNVTTPGIGAFSYCPGTVVNLVATPALGYAFNTWSGGPVGNASAGNTSITMNGNYTITASFNYVGVNWLMVNTTAGGNVTLPGLGNFTYSPLTVVNLVATPSTGCFVNWTGDTGTIADPTAASTTITMSGNYTITANFVAKYSLSVTSGTGGSVTTPNVVTSYYCPGTVVNLVASANSGYSFSNWTGNTGTMGSTTAASTTITMNGGYAIQANFQSTGGGGGGGGVVTTPTPTPTPVITPPPIPTPTPVDLSGSISGNGTVTQPIVYSVLDGQAVLTIPVGTMALTATGLALQSISVTEVCFGIPAAPAGAYIIGCAYDYTPAGATFNPPITLTLKYDPGLLPAGFDASKLVIAYYDTATSMWVVLPSTVDTVNDTVSAQVSHFTLFAVYAAVPAATPTPTPTTTVAPTPTPTPTPTPVSPSKKTNIGVIIGPIIAVIVILLVAYWFWMRRRKPPAPPAPTEGPAKEPPPAGPKKT